MKLLLTIPLFLFLQFSIAQEFFEVLPKPFPEVLEGELEFADFNGDQFPDVILTGRMGFDEATVIYLNDGEGNFAETDQSNLAGVTRSAIAVFDADQDSDLDIFISGAGDFSERQANLYINDGNASFTAADNSVFTGFDNGSVAAGDLNGDGRVDLFVAGRFNQSNEDIAEFYINEGEGVFSKLVLPQIAPFSFGTAKLADFDQDGRLDLLVSGSIDNLNAPMTNVFMNKGDLVFEEKVDSGLEDLTFSSSDVADVNMDGHLDIVISGRGSASVTQLYINDGLGTFTLDVGSFEGVEYGVSRFTDINSDSYPDIFTTGRQGLTELVLGVYLNDGQGNFNEFEINDVSPIRVGDVEFADIDGDSDMDMLISGNLLDFGTEESTSLYGNSLLSGLDYADNLDSETLKFFPNPADTYIQLTEISTYENAQLSIYDSQGQLVQRIEVNPSQKVNISDLNPGILILELKVGKDVLRQKLLKI